MPLIALSRLFYPRNVPLWGLTTLRDGGVDAKRVFRATVRGTRVVVVAIRGLSAHTFPGGRRPKGARFVPIAKIVGGAHQPIVAGTGLVEILTACQHIA